jgi:fructose/tagatose bisphosphate aldolase
VATQLNQAFTQAVRLKLAEDAKVDPRKYLSRARNEMKERVRERIRFFGAAGKV